MGSLVIKMMQSPFFGVLITMLLYGVFCVQTFHYANNHSNSDRKLIRWLVAGVWALESLHTAFSIHFIEYYLILHHDEPAVIDCIVWSMGAAYICGFLVAGIVDLFFVWRVWKLSDHAAICIFLTILSTVRTGIAISNASLSFKYPKALQFFNIVQPTLILEWVLSASTDSLIAITQCYYLHKQRNGIKSTDRAINRLLLYTINTGVLTSLFAILVILSFLAFPGTMDYAGFVQVQSKMYAISILASLNARRGIAEASRRNDPVVNTASLELLGQTGVEPGKRDQPYPTIRSTDLSRVIPDGETDSAI